MRANEVLLTLNTTEANSDERDERLREHDQHLVGYNVFPPGAKGEDVELVVSVYDDGSISLLAPLMKTSCAVADPDELYRVLVEDVAGRCDNPETVASMIMLALGFVTYDRSDTTLH